MKVRTKIKTIESRNKENVVTGIKREIQTINGRNNWRCKQLKTETKQINLNEDRNNYSKIQLKVEAEKLNCNLETFEKVETIEGKHN